MIVGVEKSWPRFPFILFTHFYHGPVNFSGSGCLPGAEQSGIKCPVCPIVQLVFRVFKLPYRRFFHRSFYIFRSEGFFIFLSAAIYRQNQKNKKNGQIFHVQFFSKIIIGLKLSKVAGFSLWLYRPGNHDPGRHFTFRKIISQCLVRNDNFLLFGTGV